MVFEFDMKGKEMDNSKNTNSILLTLEEKSNIDAKIVEIRNEYPSTQDNNFDLIDFLKTKFSFEIIEVPLSDETTGMIIVDDNNLLAFKNFKTNRIIVTTSKLNQFVNYFQKRRFIIAHEFGHFILHKKKQQIQFAKRDTEHFNTKEEQQAEYFARSFLMPEDKVKEIILSINDSSVNEKVDEIKKVFNVTENKARYRLQELSLI